MNKPDFEKIKHRAKKIGICTGVLAVLCVIIFGVQVASLLRFDENGAHVEDKYGVFAPKKEQTETLEAPEKKEEKQEEPSEPEKIKPVYQDKSAPKLEAVFAVAERMANDDSYMRTVEDTSGYAKQVVADFKDENGKVSFPVDSSVMSGVWSSFAKWFHYAQEESEAAGLEVYAQIYCFRDHEAIEENGTEYAVQTADGEAWQTEDESYWLDPTDEDVQTYLTELVEQTAELGVKEIILRDFLFPNTDTALKFDQDGDKAEQLIMLYSKLQTVAGEVPVSIYLDDVSADNEKTGQNLAMMYHNAYRLYAPADSAEQAQKLAQTVAEQTGGNAHFVPWYSSDLGFDTLKTGAVYNFN